MQMQCRHTLGLATGVCDQEHAKCLCSLLMDTADYDCAGRLHFVTSLYSSAGTNIVTGCMPELRERMQTKQYKPHLTKGGKLQIINEVDETGSDHSVK